MHDMRVQIIYPQRLKSARSHVQCHEGSADAHLLDAPNELRIEVQTRRRGGHGSPLSGENTLIALAIIFIRGAVDVRRKRYIAPLLEEFKRGTREFDAPQVILPAPDSHSSTDRGDFQPFPDWFAGTQLHESFVFRVGVTRSRNISTRPPEGLVPKSRAATTLVSLKTRRSPGRKRLGKSRIVQSRSTAPVPVRRTAGAAGGPSDWLRSGKLLGTCKSSGSSTSSRLAERSASGVWAISSGGRS